MSQNCVKERYYHDAKTIYVEDMDAFQSEFEEYISQCKSNFSYCYSLENKHAMDLPEFT